MGALRLSDLRVYASHFCRSASSADRVAVSQDANTQRVHGTILDNEQPNYV